MTPERTVDTTYVSPILADSALFKRALRHKVKLRAVYNELKRKGVSHSYLYFFNINKKGILEPTRYGPDKAGHFKNVKSFLKTEFNHYKWFAGYKKKNPKDRIIVLLEMFISIEPDENMVSIEIEDVENMHKIVFIKIPYKQLL